MSASLVGSEMCIRDRHSHYHVDERTVEPFGREVHAVARLQDGEGEAAVSYTHLTLPTICSV
eukprot:4444182-Alexandrium_andersonii.AAC.1